MFLSTINANKTKIFPDTVKIMHIPRLMAIRMVCQRTNGGRTGLTVVSSPVSEEFLVYVELEKSKDSLPKRLRGSGSSSLNTLVELNAWVHSANDRMLL